MLSSALSAVSVHSGVKTALVGPASVGVTIDSKSPLVIYILGVSASG
jgi:hypothetical protein